MSVPTDEEVREALKMVYDPEIGINIVDLGLIYNVDVSEEGLVDLDMTLTAPGCPLSHVIGAQVREALDGIPGLTDVKLNLVWSPPWNPSMMSQEAKDELGMDQY